MVDELFQGRLLMEYDCGFQKEKNWFRYRAAAIIVEEGCVLFAGNERDNYYYSIGGGVHMNEAAFYFLMKPRGTKELNSNSYTGGFKENMYWIPIGEIGKHRAYPTFMKEYLQKRPQEIVHIVTNERAAK